MELDQIIQLINTVSDSSLTGFTLEEGNMKLVFDKQISNGSLEVEIPKTLVQAGTVSKEEIKEKKKSCEDGMQIKSPLVGTFYHSPSPDEAPYVQTGDIVKQGQILGIVEAMKLMNEIECEYDGIVEAILIQNEQMVEYGQPLFRIKSL